MSWFDEFSDWLLRLAGVDQSESYVVDKPPPPLVRPVPRQDGSTYWVFTTEFDVEAPVALLEKFVGKLADDERARIDARWASIHLDAEAIAAWAETHQDGDDLADTAIALLLDHSGSLRNGLIDQEAVVAKSFIRAMSHLGLAYEVLGHTTLSWKGGRSAEKWRSTGRRPMPGRVCDLLHVVYGDEISLNGDDGALAAMFHPQLLRENVDGEALEWALGRLRARPQQHKRLLVVSDGAPNDDATTAYSGSGMLHFHLQDVIAGVSDARLAAIQLGQIPSPYGNAVSVASLDQAQPSVLKALDQLLHSPRGD